MHTVNYQDKQCKFCGALFIPESPNQQYCKGPHYMTCPVCGNEYVVKNNLNLKKPAVACSYKCRTERIKQVSLQKYGVVAPGSTPEAREKSRKTMQEKYGVDYAMQSAEIKEKSQQTLIDKYGVDNIQKLTSIRKKSIFTLNHNWNVLIKKEFPLKLREDPYSHKLFKIDETQMQVFQLKEKASIAFLSKYGNSIKKKFGKVHMSVGLVQDNILYQVLRFEKQNGKIVLADFGTRGNYFNPNYYSKVLRAAVNIVGLEEFTAVIPRTKAVPELIQSLSLKLVKEGMYVPYWILEDGQVKRVTTRDNIEEMKSKYDYVTSDYLDQYVYESCDLSGEFLSLRMFEG